MFPPLKCSSYLYNNVGVPQGAVLSPFLFSLHTNSFSSRHSRLLKYADDFVLCNSFCKYSDQGELDDDLHRLVTLGADHGLLINKTKCAECLIYPKNTSPNSRSPSLTVKHYLESIWSSILVYISTRTWPGPLTLILSLLTVLQYVFFPEGSVQWTSTNCFRLCYPYYFILFTNHFPGLLNKDFASIKKCIRLLSASSGEAYTHLCKVRISQHFNSCTRLSASIINDPLHSLHPCFSNALSTSYTRFSFKLLRCRTSLYRNSLIPSLARLLVNPKQEVDLLSTIYPLMYSLTTYHSFFLSIHISPRMPTSSIRIHE